MKKEMLRVLLFVERDVWGDALHLNPTIARGSPRSGPIPFDLTC